MQHNFKVLDAPQLAVHIALELVLKRKQLIDWHVALEYEQLVLSDHVELLVEAQVAPINGLQVSTQRHKIVPLIILNLLDLDILDVAQQLTAYPINQFERVDAVDYQRASLHFFPVV